MGIRRKILLYFSLTTISLTGIVFFFIYTLFAEYREEEFQQRQKEKIRSTLFFLSEIKKADRELIEAIDRLTIDDLYDEKLLIFNDHKELIYSSIDDTPIQYSNDILEKLSPESEWFEGKDELYDVVGRYFQNDGNAYYGISKAYDTFGYSKLNYLRLILFSSFLIISVAVILISYFLSQKITHPLVMLTRRIGSYNFDNEYTPIELERSKNEISVLAEQFNKLTKKINDVFSFQKHAVHHISHELKTPISILVSNFEKIENETEPEKIKALIRSQKEDTRNLGEIINALLEIAKTETGNVLKQDKFRIDELIFDVTAELKNIYPDFQFLIKYGSQTEDESRLTVTANASLIKSALMNLIQNSILYSSDNRANIMIAANDHAVEIVIENNGIPISGNERQYLFQHFFRGKNSKGKRGFGLGLVLVHRIITLHSGTVAYHSRDKQSNIFTVVLPAL